MDTAPPHPPSSDERPPPTRPERPRALSDRSGATGEGHPGPERSTHPEPPPSDLLAALRHRRADPDLTAEHPGRYLLRGVLGEGGIGVVDRVYDRHLRREVAIKRLRPALARRHGPLEGRFLDEARVTGLLEHPGIVPVYELGRRPDGALYYAMKQIRGETLRAAARGADLAGRLRLLPRFVAACQAVAYAHSRGVIHRDLKPDNVMIGAFGETLVLDWGLAKVAADDAPRAASAPDTHGRTMDGQVLGTPAYMPPEQLEGRIAEIDARADVWALGVMLFELCTGRAPFGDGRDFARLARRVLTEPAPSPVELEPRCPRELAAIVRRALRRDPAERYPHAGALVDDLLAYEAGGRVAAHRYSPRERLTRWIHRHRIALVVAAAVLVAALATWIGRGAREADRAALDDARRRAVVLAEVDRSIDAARETRTPGWLDLYPSRLVGLKEPAVEDRLIAHLADPDPGIRRLAARTLGLMSSRHAVDALTARLADGVEPDEAVVIEIIRALGIIGDPRAEPAVYAARKRYGNQSHVGQNTMLAYRMLPPAPPPPDADADAWVDHGRALVEKGHYLAGVTAYDRAIALDDRLARAHSNRALALRRLGRYAEALDGFARALAIEPDYAPALVTRALTLRDRGDFTAALADLDRMTIAHPEYAGLTHRARAVVHAMAGHPDAARADAAAATRAQPDDRQATAAEGRALQLIGAIEPALAAFNRAIELDPGDALTYQQRARLHLALGDLRAAKADLDYALRLDPALETLAVDRTRVLWALGEREAARAVADAAVETEPGEGHHRANRAAFIHATAGDWPAAAADLAAAVERATPADRVMYALLAAVARRRAGGDGAIEIEPASEIPYHDVLIATATRGAPAPPPPTPRDRCLRALADWLGGVGDGRLGPAEGHAAVDPEIAEAACALVAALDR